MNHDPQLIAEFEQMLAEQDTLHEEQLDILICCEVVYTEESV